MDNIKLSPPWITFVHEVEALFEQDPEVNIRYDDAEHIIKLYVNNADKADALSKLIPGTKKFGNVTVKVNVIPPNLNDCSTEELFTKAFTGNPALYGYASYDTPLGHVEYAVFKKKVVQFFNDQMDDINGNKSMLFQDIAKDVFGNKHGVFYCTEASDELSKPLGEWP